MNLDRLVPLDEASLSRIERHWRTNGFAALTAWREDVPAAENRKNLTALKGLVKAAGYGWIQVAGVWRDPGQQATHEPSLIIPAARRTTDAGDEARLMRDSADLRALAIKWGDRFGQWGVLFAAPSGQAEVITTSVRLAGKPNGTVVDRLRLFRPGDTGADLRTVVSRASHRALVRGRAAKHLDEPSKTFALESVMIERAPALPTEAMVRQAMGEVFVQTITWD